MTNPFNDTIDQDYNPFAMTGSLEEAPQPANDAPAYPEPTNNSFDSPYQDNSYDANQPKSTLKDGVTGVSITEEDIRKREEVLAERERKISQREREIEDARANGTLDQLNSHKRNFPFLLNMYKYYPDEDIPEEGQPLVKHIMWCTYIGGILLLLNAIVCLFQLLPGPSSVDSTSISASIVFSFVYLFVMYPLSLELMLMPLYNSLKEGKGMKFVGFLIMFAIYIIFFIYITIGLGEWGSVGWIRTITLFGAKENKWVGGIGCVFSILSTAFVVLCGYLFWTAFKFFRNTDISKKAVGEAAHAAANFANDHKDEIAAAARENPELAATAAQALTA